MLKYYLDEFAFPPPPNLVFVGCRCKKSNEIKQREKDKNAIGASVLALLGKKWMTRFCSPDDLLGDRTAEIAKPLIVSFVILFI